MDVQLPLDVVKIQELLPHRYPFLLVDRVTEFEPNKRIVGIKNVTINEPFFQGHFPGHPVMPGVLVIEALAQTGGILTQLSHQAAATDAPSASIRCESWVSTPPACASASMTSTPGITGRPGKWPWKKGSLMLTFLMPIALSASCISVTLSTISMG